jgi:chromosome segregation and condensation protein ScpB
LLLTDWSPLPRSLPIERHLNVERPVALSKAALEALAIVAYRQPIARSGIELIRGSASDSAIATLLERGLIAYNPHHLFVTHAGISRLGRRERSRGTHGASARQLTRVC